MGNSATQTLEQTLYLWSVVHNKVLSFKHEDIVGRLHSPFEEDQYLDKEHLQFVLENGRWHVLGRETTNGTHLNTNELKPDQKIAIDSFDVLMGGDQILVILGRELVNIKEREEFLKKINLDSPDFAEQYKSIQNRSVAFFKLEYPNFISLIKKLELQRKIEIAEAKKAQDLKPFDERIAQFNEKISIIEQKRQKVVSAWNNKIAEFKNAIEAIKDE